MGLFSKPEIIGPGGTGDADRNRITELEKRVARLELQLAQLAQGARSGAGPDVSPDAWLGDVRALVADDKLLHAIKLYREKTGCSLKQAKDAVEALQR